MTEAGRKKKRKREHARAKYFDEVLARYGEICHWCRREIIRLQHILLEGYKILKIKSAYVIFVNHFGVERRVRCASIEHLIPLSRGGSHEPENMRPACWNCNKNRKDSLRPGFSGNGGFSGGGGD